MPEVNLRELTVLIPLLAAKVKALGDEIADPATSEDDRVDAQDMQAHYDDMLDSLCQRYDAGLTGGVNLPKAEELIASYAE